MLNELTQYLDNWLLEHDFEIKCELDTDFNFDNCTDTLYYSLSVPERHEEYFIEVCKECEPDIINIDNFLLSFFHELGHYMTLDQFTSKQWESYMKFTKSLVNLDKPTKKDFMKYYHTPIELEATKWGCKYIIEHQNECKLFCDNVSEIVQSFYKSFNVEVN